MTATNDFDTLVFCTSYMADQTAWHSRYERWLNHHAPLPFKRPLFCLVDDGSAYLPDRKQVQIIEHGQPFPISPTLPLMIHFPNRLGRSSMANYPGWWRSFLYSVFVAHHYGCHKIVHIESDAFVLTQHMIERIVNHNTGWTAVWCPRWSFPEAAIQFIHEDQFGAMQDLWNAGWERHAGTLAEYILPFTHMMTSLFGDRYSEYMPSIPDHADFATQVLPSHKVWFK